ncbi:MAG: ABC transporter substrate-binding protein [Desulfomonile tiedjei]|nr:ABC transporter substrate-binding protein [Desulfomonile tiedjei]
MGVMSSGTSGREKESKPFGGSRASVPAIGRTPGSPTEPVLRHQASGISRRDFLIYSAASATVLLAGPHPVHAEQSGPLKVGIILPETGPSAAEGKSMFAGFELCLKEKGSEASRVEVHKKDPGPDDAQTLEAVAELVVNLKVSFLVAPPSLEGSVKTIHGLAGAKPILFVTNPCVRFVAGDVCVPTAFRVRPNSYQAAQPLAPWALRNVGKKVFIMGDDDPEGNEEADFFALGFERAGGTFLDRRMASPEAKEIEAVLEAAVKAEPDFIFASFRRDSAAAFLKALREAKPAIKQPVIGPESLTAFPLIVTDATTGWAGIKTLTSFRNPRDFVAAIKAKLQVDVADASRAAEGYDMAQAILRVAQQIPQETDSDKIVDFIRGIEIDGPRGKITFDANHEAIVPVMVQEWVSKSDAVNQMIVQDLGEARSPDFGCGRIGFPRRPEDESEAEKPSDSRDVDVIWDEDNP